MASVTTYTTYDDVRAVLGVSDDELEDATLALEVYASGLTLDMMDIGTTLPSTYSATLAIDEGSRSADEQKFLLLASQFATYQVARTVGSVLPMFAQSITDGKAAMSRFSGAPYKDVMARVEGEYARIRNELEGIFATLTGGSVTVAASPTYLVAAAPSIDRVTNS